MPLRALPFTSGSAMEGPERCRIDLESPAAFAASTVGPRPVAYLLRNEDVADLARHAALRATLVDRGSKHPAKGLGELLLGYEQPPLIRGSYRSWGKVVQSIRTLLRNAEDAGERQLYLVGADADLFEVLWSRAPVPAPPGGRSARDALPAGPDGADLESGALGILALLDPLPVPQELERRFVGSSASVQLVRQLILRAARTDVPVLILGDTGTGKEVVARGIHEHGSHPTDRFVAVNCGAIPGELLESELFGHKRGAFTTAVTSKEGLWKLAGRGTLFLDEIGDLRLDHQAKILRALQEGTFRAVGGKDEIRVHARVIAATNRDLYAMVRAGEFRSDLYFRLRTFLIRTPSLRDHPEDIPALAAHFWRRVTGDPSAMLPPPVLAELRRRAWPGNARELRSVLDQMSSLFPDAPASWEHLQAVFRLHGYAIAEAASSPVERSLERLQSREPLLRLEDAVCAVRATLEPLLRRGAKRESLNRIRAALQHRLDELRVFLDQQESGDRGDAPLPGRAVEAVRRMRRHLIDLTVALEVDPASARRRSTQVIAGEVDVVLAIIERELRAVDRA